MQRKGGNLTSLQIRDVPDGLYERLKWSAKENHRSMSQEATVLLEEKLGLSNENGEVYKSEAERIQERAEELERIWAELDEINKNVKPIPKEVQEQIMEECRIERENRGWVITMTRHAPVKNFRYLR